MRSISISNISKMIQLRVAIILIVDNSLLNTRRLRVDKRQMRNESPALIVGVWIVKRTNIMNRWYGAYCIAATDHVLCNFPVHNSHCKLVCSHAHSCGLRLGAEQMKNRSISQSKMTKRAKKTKLTWKNLNNDYLSGAQLR